MSPVKWHSLTAEEVLRETKTHPARGLTTEEAAQRLREYGPNELAEKPPTSFWLRLLYQFNSFVIYLLLVAAAASFVLGDKIEALAILSIVLLNGILGIIQEGRAEASLKSLKKLAAPTTKVVRSENIQILPAAQLVLGDMVILEAGDQIPADLRLIETVNLRVNEASLTGESTAVEKSANAVLPTSAVLGDRKNMAYMGTLITYGRGRGVVVATGMRTEVGHITGLLASTKEENTPLQKRLDQLGRTLSIAALVICGMVFFIGTLQDRQQGIDLATSLKESFIIAVSLAIAAVPEGLPAVVTINLALGMRRMIQSHALIRRLPAVETLGSATVIASDKTGTLTQNQMTVVSLYANGHIIDLVNPENGDWQNEPTVKQLVLGGLLASDARLESDADTKEGYVVIGDATEAALVRLAVRANLQQAVAEKQYPRIAEIPFDSDRKRMTTIHQLADGTYLAFVKGAPDLLLNLCDSFKNNGQSIPLDQEQFHQINQTMASNALRVLAVAQKQLHTLPAEITSETMENHLDLLGLVALHDPARPEVGGAIAQARRAGIKTLMVTGDYVDTAQAIARSIGLLREGGQILSGEEIENLTDEELAEQIENIDVFARVSPHHKVRIVDALDSQGHIVAMTGDGVNDAPALKRASIGVAMGITGTDVSKENADMVLTDDNYASIVAAVEQGRIIYDNIRNFVYYLLSCNVAEIAVIFIAALVGWPVPLTAIQLLWLNLITDGAPALALGVERGDPDVMERPPRSPQEPIITHEMWLNVAIQTIVMTGATLLVFAIGLGRIELPFVTIQPGEQTARVMAFVTLSSAQLARAYTARSEHFSIFRLGVFSNKYMQYAVASSFVGLLIVIYVPPLQGIFDTITMNLNHWLIMLPLLLLPAVIAEVTKIVMPWMKRFSIGKEPESVF
ncbi:MAG: calcium-translocating P-type ATPase, PMCA-type [Anaerolineae bacterium]|nr:calcium-translocating P-type ATPase, PMCA-type [Anaerolineae bacterium]